MRKRTQKQEQARRFRAGIFALRCAGYTCREIAKHLNRRYKWVVDVSNHAESELYHSLTPLARAYFRWHWQTDDAYREMLRINRANGLIPQ